MDTQKMFEMILGEIKGFKEEVNTRFDSLEKGQEEIRADVAELKSDVAELKVRVGKLEEGQKALNAKVDRLEEKMEQNFKETQEQIVKVVNELGDNSELKTLEKIVAMNTFDIQKLKTKVS